MNQQPKTQSTTGEAAKHQALEIAKDVHEVYGTMGTEKLVAAIKNLCDEVEVLRELAPNGPLFCSCGGALSAQEYVAHRSMGHDSGGINLR